MSEIERFAGPDVNKMLVGNKCDMVSKKQVDFSTAKASTGVGWVMWMCVLHANFGRDSAQHRVYMLLLIAS